MHLLTKTYKTLEDQLKEFGSGIEVTLLAAIPAGSGLEQVPFLLLPYLVLFLISADWLGIRMKFASVHWFWNNYLLPVVVGKTNTEECFTE
jgi:hypothetical protein